MNNDILESIISFTNSKEKSIQIASLWVLMNLLWKNEEGNI
jgi:hypothetical protein